jgi:hypothetical protein
MKRTSHVLRIALLIVACLLGASAIGPAAAQDTDLANHPVVGSWRVMLGDDPHVHGLLTHHADGTVTSTDPATMAVAPGVVAYVSAAHGVWEPTGPTTAAYTIQGFTNDAEGNVTGYVTISGERDTSADGQTFGGAGIFQVADAEGNVLLSAPAPDVRGERMSVVPIEALATPAG